MSDKTLGAPDFAALTGLDGARAEEVERDFPSPPLVYRVLSSAERDSIIRRVDEEIRTRDMRISGGSDSTVWQKGWDEVADRLASGIIDYQSLKPQYFHEGAPPCRLSGTFIQPSSNEFEYWAGVRLRALLMREFLSDCDCVIEYGCGTGINLLIAQQLFPRARLIGTDWAHASVRILASMARQTGASIEGHQFDMLAARGWDAAPGGPKTGVLTVHAMEQLHTGWRPFLNYVRGLKPGLCVHIEPVLELYDPTDPLDDLARRYHLKRHYLEGYLTELYRLAAAGEIEIIRRQRIYFGGLYHEAYSLIVWRP
jgi:hypothetical protein